MGFSFELVLTQQSHPSMFNKKAKFLNTVKWKLHDSGHDEQFISDVVVILTASLNT